jgi:hypothetical protein
MSDTAHPGSSLADIAPSDARVTAPRVAFQCDGGECCEAVVLKGLIRCSVEEVNELGE